MPLAADPRLADNRGRADVSWSLTTSQVEPPALTLLTRFGLQARSYQIFPIFQFEENRIIAPWDFVSPPMIHTFTTNQLTLSFMPHADLSCHITYWIPDGDSAGGEMTLTNQGRQDLNFPFRMAAVLIPDENGERLQAQSLAGRTVLSGRTQERFPLLFMTGGAAPESAPFPCLTLEVELPPSQPKAVRWVTTALGSREASFQKALDILDMNWQAQFTRSENLWQSGLQIETGNPEWDLAFALSRKVGLGSLSSRDRGEDLQIIPSRLDPTLPSSGKVDAGQTGFLRGSSALQSYYLADVLYPLDGTLRDTLLAQNLDAFSTDNQSGEKSHSKYKLPPLPLLAQLALKVLPRPLSPPSIERWFPALATYLEAWFSPEQDRDGDGVPEWSRVDQVECRAHPTHYTSPDWFLRPQIQFMESPALSALLVQEIDSLLTMANMLGKAENQRRFQSRKTKLVEAIDCSWQEEHHRYQRWDRDSHHSPAGQTLAKNRGPGLTIINKKLETPSRVVLHFQGEKPLSPKTKVFIHGKSPGNAHWVERLSSTRIHWHQNHGNLTSDHVYQFLEYVVLYGIDESIEVEVHVGEVQAEDILLLLPLQFGLTAGEKSQAMIKHNILEEDQYWSQYGLRSTLNPKHADILLPWNLLVGEGLLALDAQEEAARLMTNIMNAITANLDRGRPFFARYHPETGKGLGKGYQFTGSAPIGFFMRTLGVEIRSQHECVLWGTNPYPWPIRLSYRGLELIRDQEKATISFPGGQKTVVQGPDKKVIRLGQEEDSRK